MPSHEIHQLIGSILGLQTAEIDKLMDEPFKILGRRHRILRHDETFILLLANFSEEAALCAWLHLMLDEDKYKTLETLSKRAMTVRCEICGKEFANTRALGSHMHYKHKRRGEEGDRTPQGDLLRAYGEFEKATLRDLLSEDLALRIEERRRRLLREDERIDEIRERISSLVELEETVKSLKTLCERLYETVQNLRTKLELRELKKCPCKEPTIIPLLSPQGIVPFCLTKSEVCVYYSVIETATCPCGNVIDVSPVPIGSLFTCNRCGFTQIKTHYGNFQIVRRA